jgi:release factor glutamine methyltransferase
VLIPRPETETLVECALRALPADRSARVLDLGTGSGAIALAIACERPQVQVLATDISAAALAVAKRNAELMKLRNVRWLQSDWYERLSDDAALFDLIASNRAALFDLIASNPPYVADADPHLAEGDARFEPALALRGGRDGLDALRVVIAGASAWLAPEGALVVEHGYDQAEAVRALMCAAGLADAGVFRDLAGIRRISVATKAVVTATPNWSIATSKSGS